MQQVSFIAMENGTREEYEFLAHQEVGFVASLPDRLLDHLKSLEDSLSGYRVTRLEHSLQSATRAHRGGEDEDYVVAALLHDIGDQLAPLSHGEMAAAILKPFVSERIHWIIKHHGVFQMVYYAHHLGEDRDARERYRESPWFDDTARFCALYDQNCFDPDYPSENLEFFAPMVRRVFSKTPFQND